MSLHRKPPFNVPNQKTEYCVQFIPANDMKGSVFGHLTFPRLPSCETQLIMTVDDLARGLNEKQQFDAQRLSSLTSNKVPHR